jgi:NAD(P)-dependent dehydrogenase (short-subunit alcohol dehydrogenase family)
MTRGVAARGVAVVTGASGGIGAAIALRLASDGFAVAVAFHANEAAALGVVAAIRQGGGQAAAVRADVRRQDDVQALFAAADRELGRASVLVNCVGVLGAERAIDDVDADELADLFASNVSSAFLCAREAVRRMAPRHGGEGGSIVNVSSMAGVRGGSERRVAYGASKGALNAFTLGLGRELASDGIRVNAIVAGYVDTSVHGGAERQARLASAVAATPMKRAGAPAEIAEAAAWLVSDKSSFVTSTLLTVAGGA